MLRKSAGAASLSHIGSIIYIMRHALYLEERRDLWTDSRDGRIIWLPWHRACTFCPSGSVRCKSRTRLSWLSIKIIAYKSLFFYKDDKWETERRCKNTCCSAEHRRRVETDLVWVSKAAITSIRLNEGKQFSVMVLNRAYLQASGMEEEALHQSSAKRLQLFNELRALGKQIWTLPHYSFKLNLEDSTLHSKIERKFNFTVQSRPQDTMQENAEPFYSKWKKINNLAELRYPSGRIFRIDLL